MNCNKCGKRKSKDEFHRDNRAKSGRKSICKLCRSDDSIINSTNLQAVEKVEELLEIYKSGSFAGRKLMELVALDKKIRFPPTNTIKINGAMIPSDDKEIYIQSKLGLYFAKNNISAQISKIILGPTYNIDSKIYIKLDSFVESNLVEKIVAFLVDASTNNKILLDNVKNHKKVFDFVKSSLHVDANPNLNINNDGVQIVWDKKYAIRSAQYKKLIKTVKTM